MGTQYENPHWGKPSTNRSAASSTASTNHSSWDQLIITENDTEAWPSICRSESQSRHTLPGGCGVDADVGGPASSSSRSLSMATGANGQTGHFPANHPSSKASSAPGLANHTGAAVVSSQAAANRGWGSGPVPSHCSPQSSVGGGDGKSDGPMGGSRGWGSGSSSASNFNLNLNPNANPSAWPVLGHDGGGAGGGSSGGANSPPQPPPSLCNPPGAPSAQRNGNAGKIGRAHV